MQFGELASKLTEGNENYDLLIVFNFITSMKKQRDAEKRDGKTFYLVLSYKKNMYLNTKKKKPNKPTNYDHLMTQRKESPSVC